MTQLKLKTPNIANIHTVYLVLKKAGKYFVSSAELKGK